MKILCITHAEFESPGVIVDWAQDSGHPLKIVAPYQGDSLKNRDFDFLIIMGGPQSPLKIVKYPYLQEEIDFIQATIQQGKSILGFCLGAQLIGEAFGAKTERSPEKEMGVFPITLTQEGQEDPLLKNLGTSFPVIHWHNDMPGLTENTSLLAYSEGCPRQIVRYAPHVYGFQCHLEITMKGIKSLVKACPQDLIASPFVQTKEALLAQSYSHINHMMFTLLDRFVKMEKEKLSSRN